MGGIKRDHKDNGPCDDIEKRAQHLCAQVNRDCCRAKHIAHLSGLFLIPGPEQQRLSDCLYLHGDDTGLFSLSWRRAVAPIAGNLQNVSRPLAQVCTAARK
jgi:hypothetical protein